MRSQADKLGADPHRIAAYGLSAGRHLAAVFDQPEPGQPSAASNALVLVSPAVSVTPDRWFQRLLGQRTQAAADQFLRSLGYLK